jgi:hypothetical protein
MIDELERSSHSIIEVLSLNVPGWTEENNEKLRSGYTVSRPRFDPSISRIYVQSVRARPSCSVLLYVSSSMCHVT